MLVSRIEMQLLQKSTASWRMFVARQQQKTAARHFAGMKLQQQALLAWVQLAGWSRGRRSAAESMAIRLSTRMHNYQLHACFSTWIIRVRQTKAAKVMLQSNIAKNASKALEKCFPELALLHVDPGSCHSGCSACLSVY
jgi:hypothetical protein